MGSNLFFKRCFSLVVMFLLPWGLPQVVVAGPSATGQSIANVSKPRSIVMIDELKFGQIRPQYSAGTVTVAPEDNARTASDPDLLAAINSGKHQRAKFEIKGPENSLFSITLASTKAQHDNGINPSLDVTDLTSFSKNLVSFDLKGKTDSDGEDKIFVGGTLQVPANAKNGKYEGEVTITINF